MIIDHYGLNIIISLVFVIFLLLCLLLVDHVVQFINIKVLVERLVAVYLNFEATILQIPLIFVQDSLLFIKLVSCLTVDMEFKAMLHPIFVAFAAC